MNNKYEMVVGLEVHAELSTDTKIFCYCKNEFGKEVNSACCPVCTGMPGALPVLNEKVVDYAILMGHAMNCKINRICKQDRKNYFYPDLPKAYQISQFEVPLCENGYIDVLLKSGDTKRIGVTRIHIEEDAGKLLHDKSFDGTLVDFNRCGVPLIEIVSEPDIRSSEEAHAYLETIRSYLLYLGISDAKMQEGSIRCDVNVSVRLKGDDKFNTRCEMKNVNTFSGAVRAIEYEARRQIEILEEGGTILQQTLKWDDDLGESIPLRSKEDAQDYRYFPDPDLKTIVVDEKKVLELKEKVSEMPNNKSIRYFKEYGIPVVDAVFLAENKNRAELFEKTIELNDSLDKKTVSNWIITNITKVVNKDERDYFDVITPSNLCELISNIQNGTISNAAGKTVFSIIINDSSKSVSDIIKENSLSQISDSNELLSIAADVIKNNEKSVNDYKNGKTNALGYLVGQAMKATHGKGNPKLLKDTLIKLLDEN